jgi:hypothetical protein
MLLPLISRVLAASDEYDRKSAALNDPANAHHKANIEANYAVLSILDAKASALMRLDGVLLAAALFGITGKLYEIKTWQFTTIVFLCLASMVACLFVVSVDWKFLGLVTRTATGFDFTAEIENLRKVRQFRETTYRFAWTLALLASVDFAIVILLKLLS